jgi:hypothetical protein
MHTQTSSASGDKYPILKLALAQAFEYAVEEHAPKEYRPIIIDELPQIPGREYSDDRFHPAGDVGVLPA